MDLQFGHYLLKRTERQVLGPQGPVELSARSFDILRAFVMFTSRRGHRSSMAWFERSHRTDEEEFIRRKQM